MDIDPQYKTADGSAIRIWRDTAKNNYLSEVNGRAIFDEIIWLEVIPPGSRGSTPIFEVERTFAAEAAELNMKPVRQGTQYAQYATIIEAFKKNDEGDASMAGLPLKEWPAITRSLAAAMHEARIYTVEGLAAVSDEKLRVIGADGRAWRDKAIAYLESAKDGAYVSKLVMELDAQKLALADKDRQLVELNARVSKVEAAARKGAKAVEAPATIVQDDNARPTIIQDDVLPSIV